MNRIPSLWTITRWLLALVVLAAGIVPAAPAASSAPALVEINLRTPADTAAFARSGLPVYARLSQADGTEVLLARLDPGAQAQLRQAGLSLRSLETSPAAAGEGYYLLTPRRAAQAAELAAHPGFLAQYGAQFLLRLLPVAAEALDPLGMRALQPAPLVLTSLETNLPQDITPDARIQAVLNQITTTDVSNIDGGLSGEWPVDVDGLPYTILTRHSRTTIPIERATQYAYEWFTRVGLSTSFHDYNLPGTGTRRNVVGEQYGAGQSDRIFLITAHLDSTSQTPSTLAPGADDNASGSTAVLIAAELLSQLNFDCTLRYVLFTGEEQGLYGSEAYAAMAYANGDDIEAVLNLDMIAYDSDAFPIFELHTRPGNAADTAIANLFSDVVDAYNLDLMLEIEPSGIQASDHASFWGFGYPAILGIEDFEDFTPFYHTTGDQLETLNLTYFTEAVKASVATFAHLGCLLADEGSLAGIVTDQGTADPLPGALVSATDGNTTFTDTTDSQGHYDIDLPAGEYEVTASADGYYASVANLNVLPSQTSTHNFALAPIPHYTLSGYVTDAASGEPLSATVRMPYSPIPPVQTDPATGYYAFSLPPDAYTIQVLADGYDPQIRSVDLSGDTQEDFALVQSCTALVSLDWEYNPLAPMVGTTVTFTGTVIGGTQPITYTWDFADGTPPLVGLNLTTVTHLFPLGALPHTYPVSLQAVNHCSSPQPVVKNVLVDTHRLYLPVSYSGPGDTP